jgi:hypothetical protein
VTFRAIPIESEYGESHGMLRMAAVRDTKRLGGRTKTVFVGTSRSEEAPVAGRRGAWVAESRARGVPNERPEPQI